MPELSWKRFRKEIVSLRCLAYESTLYNPPGGEPQPLACLLVDVAQHRDAESDEEKKEAIERQQIWSRMGFSPIDYDMRYPGYLSKARYNVGVYRERFTIFGGKYDREGDETPPRSSLQKEIFLTFLMIMFTSVWVDEAALTGEDANPVFKENPEALKKAIAESIQGLKEEFKQLPDQLEMNEKYWR
jgi:hypothetical protein